MQRPDLTPTKWNITTYHEDRLAPGYWFVAPYRLLQQQKFGTGWVGCHIYDNKGELVWSGAKLFSQGNVEDFRISNVQGEDLMTMMDQGRMEAIIFDNHYEVREAIKIDHFNSHEFHFVENGTKVLLIQGDPRETTPEMEATIGYHGDRRCRVRADRFVEVDLQNDWQTVFDWSPFHRIGLDESDYGGDNRCTQGDWDYMYV